MLEIIVVIAVILAAGIAAVLLLAARKSDTFQVVRATRIKASPHAIFPLINDLHRWAAWSPYEKKDPAMQRTFSGAASGKGAVYGWDGNKNVGAGRMEIIDSAVPSKIVIKLDFLRPFEGHNTAEFTMLPHGEATDVTWAMYGPCNFIGKVMHVFFDMDDVIGKDFAAGLENLKAITETERSTQGAVDAGQSLSVL